MKPSYAIPKVWGLGFGYFFVLGGLSLSKPNANSADATGRLLGYSIRLRFSL